MVVQALVRFLPETGPHAGPGLPPTMLPMLAGSLVVVAPCGLPLALGCRRVWRLGYRRGAGWAWIGLGAVTVAASVVAGLLGPIAIAVYAVALSLPVWGALVVARAPRLTVRRRRAGCAGLTDWVNDNSLYGADAKAVLAQFRRLVRYLKRWRDVQFSQTVAAKVYSIGLTVMVKERRAGPGEQSSGTCSPCRPRQQYFRP